ncbi:putative alkyl/aryl-sulfatase [Gordonia araii NBRC 100433]|uniref:Putative alkyl/aryl-sulfatase n=1 Tax=Gordonia araii NBRC 100433 TaxID=1073574 RepID=G7H5S0_9ACTN|nr:alkyl sulfatase dimerization domain-containing protein [Gordonia araii]NNG95905.1 MBL fold metallo-hydrolase [Gordonia araii NBRC 100433]GAB11195.1 putative alkyl/aryl-sulfatase [Gordonia araii NBRC 100433]
MTANGSYPFDDVQDFRDADRGLTATLDVAAITNSAGQAIWDFDSYAFLDGEAPDTVHPSLWRQSQLTVKHGLYEVTDSIYQIRGFDLSNMTVVEGDTGIVVIDPLISTETAAAALALYREHRGDRPVVAVIYTHCHVDHFGGVKGIVSQEEVDAGTVQIIAPEGFLEPAIAENLYAGTAMSRRAGYMYGAALPRNPRGGVGAGLGQTTSTGTVTLIEPTVDITATGQELTVDGIRMVFQLAPGTEAPAEMHFHFPDLRALCIAENATHTLHNLLTLRGAVVRDPHGWSHYLGEAIEMFADDTDVVFASHHWPTWGAERVRHFLQTQREMYAYLHDQTLRMLNRGFTGPEIAEQFQLPPKLDEAWNTHGYYGSVSHNVKAIYQRYLGWFDGNPSRLWQHPPEAAAVRYVEFMGGADAVVEKARKSFAEGDLRRTAQVLDHVVFAEPEHEAARALLADTLEKLGFGSENGPWRNFFLSGAMELRTGNFGTPTAASGYDIVSHLQPEMFIDGLAIQIDAAKVWDLDITTRWVFGETRFVTRLHNGVLLRSRDRDDTEVAATITVPDGVLVHLVTGDIAAAQAAGLKVTGDATVLGTILGALQRPDPDFNIVTP